MLAEDSKRALVVIARLQFVQESLRSNFCLWSIGFRTKQEDLIPINFPFIHFFLQMRSIKIGKILESRKVITVAIQQRAPLLLYQIQNFQKANSIKR